MIRLLRNINSTIPTLALFGALSLFAAGTAHAGGPEFVAGISYFDPAVTGTPLTWSNGTVNYYTDQGDLSPILPSVSADAFVADAFSQWTGISTAALVATEQGHLAEDVNGTNVYRDAEGDLFEPADIEPTAVNTPVGIVYDYDGSVTDALLGQGAGDSDECFYNAAYGGVDNFGTDAVLLHALVVINGQCAVKSAQLPDVEYRLVRVLGQVLGVGWSQLNLNVLTGNPHPTADDYAGFTIMHPVDPLNCVPITVCYSGNGAVNPYQPKMDDQASLSRLYPVTAENQSNFPGKQILSETTARIYGSVYFVDSTGQAAQDMQGVNVVARWVDPVTGEPSGEYAASSVSGFLFCGNAGNPASGYYDSTGLPYNSFGSNNPTLEAFFDLAGLQLPNGATSGQYQLTVEAVDPFWSISVGPYQPLQVEPSGTGQPVNVSVSLSSDSEQDLLMQGSALQQSAWFQPTTYYTPAPAPAGGDWQASFSPYADTDYFWFSGQANRTLSVVVTALDQNGAATESKSQPVVGMWALADAGTYPAPANTPSAFNTGFFGVTRLDATLYQTTDFRVGVMDYRGDGRPDYAYHARIFYGDHTTPARASVLGGTPIAVAGYGFQSDDTVAIGNLNALPLAISANQLLFTAPPQRDGLETIMLSQSSTGATSTMTNVLTYGAGPNDTIRLISGSNPATPVGGQAANPIIVQVLSWDGVTPVPGATVVFTSTPAVSFSACGGATTCTLVSDQTGEASTYVTVLSAGAMTITAQLAPASYPNPQQVQTTIVGTSSALDLSLAPQYTFIAQGADVNVMLTARVLSNGNPLNGRNVNFYLDKGTGVLNPPAATTNSNGYATSTLELSNFASDVQISVCVEPGDAPCQTLYGTAVPASAVQLQFVSGNAQILPVGDVFQPVAVRVTDSSTPPDPVLGANVTFQSLTGRSDGTPVIPEQGEGGTTNPLPVILASSQAVAVSDGNGMASTTPTTSGISGPLLIVGSAGAGLVSLQYELQSLPLLTN